MTTHAESTSRMIGAYSATSGAPKPPPTIHAAQARGGSNVAAASIRDASRQVRGDAGRSPAERRHQTGRGNDREPGGDAGQVRP